MTGPKRKQARILFLGGGLLALVFLMLYMGGFLRRDTIGPGDGAPDVPAGPPPAAQVRAARETVTEYYEAVGTVRPRTETQVEAQVMGRIVEITVRAGDLVRQGQVLVVLDDREFQARLDQARQALASAEARRGQAHQAVLAARAGYAQAEAAYRRVQAYLRSEAATAQELEVAEAAFLQAQARLEQALGGEAEAQAAVAQALQRVEESRIAFDYNRILAPADGEVGQRLADPGDMALPGKPLLVIQARGRLRLEALVREGLIQRIRPAQSLAVVIDATDMRLQGAVEEIVPAADPVTRSFLVKVALPTSEGLYPGMFGRLLVPEDEEVIVTAPLAAVRRVGQLETVLVQIEDNRWERRLIKTGRALPQGRVEVLSGLEGNETLGLGGNAGAR